MMNEANGMIAARRTGWDSAHSEESLCYEAKMEA